MAKKWYVRYLNSKKAEEVSFNEFYALSTMARFYNAVVSSSFHPNGKTLVVSFPKHFI